MKALSIQQPWAWLIVHGHKDIENRDWRTRERGRVLIHAGRSIDHAGYLFVNRHFPTIALPGIDRLDRGGIVGAATITDCVRSSNSPWFFGKFGFVLTDPEPLPFFALRGQLMFFEVPQFDSQEWRDRLLRRDLRYVDTSARK